MTKSRVLTHTLKPRPPVDARRVRVLQIRTAPPFAAHCILRRPGVSYAPARQAGKCRCSVRHIRRELAHSKWIMNFRLTIALPVAVVAAALCAPSAPAQGRGMRGARPASGARSSIRGGRRIGLGRRGQGRYLNDAGLLDPGYFYPDDEYDYGQYGPEEFPAQYVPVQTAPAPTPAAPPAEALVLENRAGQWVRVPNGGQAPTASQTGKPDSSPAPNPHPGIVDPASGIKPSPELPAAVLVFRDGHKEELQKYMIQGDAVYTSASPYSSGALTKRIPLDALDIPASLKLNKERGAKFNLPSASNEVMIRF